MKISARESFAQKRILCSSLLGIPLILMITFSSPPWKNDSYLSLLAEGTGYVFLIVATLGRFWCSIYIGGFKDNLLIKEGPYSIVRNPLYLFSFIGAIGFVLCSGNFIAVLLVLLIFVFFFPVVVRKEETKLEALFGDEFMAYKKVTPRWWPRFSNYHEPQEYLIKPRYIRKAIIDSMLFMWAFLIWEIIEKLKALNIIPLLWGGQ